jgi:hypothetical protein
VLDAVVRRTRSFQSEFLVHTPEKCWGRPPHALFVTLAIDAFQGSPDSLRRSVWSDAEGKDQIFLTVIVPHERCVPVCAVNLFPSETGHADEKTMGNARDLVTPLRVQLLVEALLAGVDGDKS